MAKEENKVKTKAKINWGWNAPEDRNGKATRSISKTTKTTGKTRKKATQKVTRKVKKIGIKAILIILLVTLFGVGIGVSACWFVSRDDCFQIIGMEEITLTLKDEDATSFTSNNIYYDEGVKVISFGRDISNDVYVETNLKQHEDGGYYADEVGTYYMIYKVDDIKYGKIFTVQRIRLITFVESTPDINVD